MPNGLTLADLGLEDNTINPQTGLQEVEGGRKAAPLTLEELDQPPVTNSDSDAYLGRGDSGIDASEFDFQPRYGADNEDIRAANQSALGMMAKGAGRLVGTTATKFLSGVGYTLSAAPALFTWDMDKMLNNSFSEFFSEVEEDIKAALPIYKTRAYEEGSLGDQMSSLAFWTDDVVDGAAFMLSSIIGAKGMNSLSKATKVYTNIAKNFSRYSKAAKTGQEIAEFTPKLKKWADAATRGTITAVNTVSESAFEAKDTKDSVLRSLENEVLLGRLSREEANLRASKAARTTFLANMGALALSNHLTTNMLFKDHDAIQLNKLFKPQNFVAKSALEAAQEVPESITKKQMAKYFAKDALLGVVSEGMYEENIQTAIQNYSMNKAKGNENRFILKALAENMVENFSTDEGLKSIALGSIMGLIPGGIGGVRSAKAEQQQKHSATMARGAVIEKMKNQAQDFYKRQPLTNEEGKVVGETDAVMIDENGNPIIDKDKIAAAFYQAYEGYTDFVESLKASAGGNKTMFDFIKTKRFSDLAMEYLMQPKGKEALNEAIEFYAEQEVDDLNRAEGRGYGASQLAEAEARQVEIEAQLNESGEGFDQAEADAVRKRIEQVRQEVTTEDIEKRRRDIEETKEKYKKLAEQLDQVLISINNNFAGLQEFGDSYQAKMFKNSLIKEQYETAVEQLFWNEEASKFERTLARDNAEERGPLKSVAGARTVKDRMRKKAQTRLNEVQNVLVEANNRMADLLDYKKQKKNFQEFYDATEKASAGKGVVDGETAEQAVAKVESTPIEEPVNIANKELTNFTAEAAEALDYFEDVDRSTALNQLTKGTNPSYFYKTYPSEGHVHIIQTNGTEEGNILSDRHLYNKEMVNTTNDKRKKVILGFNNGKLDIARIRDLDTGKVDILSMVHDLPGDKGAFDNPYTLEDLQTIWDSLPKTLGLEYTDSPISSVELNMKALDFGDVTLDQKTYDQHLQDVQGEIERGATQILDKYNRFRKAMDIPFDASRIGDLDYMRNVYGDHRYSNTRMSDHFGNGALKYLPAIYNGKVGYLEDVDGQVEFVALALEGNSVLPSSRYVISGVNSTETFSDLGIIALSMSATDIYMESDGRPYPIRIQGKYYKNPYFANPSQAIRLDSEGNPIAVTLVNPQGEKVRFRTPLIVNDIAMSIEMNQILKDKLFTDYVTEDLTNSIVIVDDKTGVEYAVYRKDGQYEIVRAADGKQMRANSGIYKRIVESFDKSFDIALKRMADNNTTSINSTKKDVKDEFRRYVQDVRPTTPEEALRLPDQREVQNSKGVPTEEPAVTNKEEEKEIEDSIAQEIAAKEEAARRKEEQDKLTNQSTAFVDNMTEGDSIETLGIDEVVDKGYDDSNFKGVADTSTAISYIWFDRDNNEFKVNNQEFLTHIINTDDFSNAVFKPVIDWDYREYWDKFPNLERSIKEGGLTKAQIDEILSVIPGDKDFKFRIDRIPIKLTYTNGETVLENGLYIHESGYPYITVPAQVTQNLTEPREILKAEEDYKENVKLKLRRLRYTLLSNMLAGKSYEIPAENINVGHPNSTKTNRSLADVLHTVESDLDLRTVELAVAVGDGTLYKNGTETSFGFGSRGNVFLVSKYTANGQPYNFKLNPAKLTREHGNIVLKALQQARQNGLQAKYQGSEVTGNLSNAAVLDHLVRQGKNFTQVSNNKAKQHLLGKQLWTTESEVVFGTSKMPLYNPTNEQVEQFLDWITTNKNYPVNKGLLGTKLDREFSIGETMKYNPNEDNYTSFLLKSGTLNTNLEVVSGTKSLTTNPVFTIDTDPLSAGVGVPISKTTKAVKNKVEPKQKVAPKEPTVQKTGTEPDNSPKVKQAVEKTNQIAAEAISNKFLGKLEGITKLRPGSKVFLRDPNNPAGQRQYFAEIVRNEKGVDVVVLMPNFKDDMAYLNTDMKNIGAFATTDAEKLRKLLDSDLSFLAGYAFYDSPAITPIEQEEQLSKEDADKEGPDNGFTNTGDTSLDDAGFSPFRMVPLTKKDYTPINIEQSRKWLKKRINTGLDIVDGLIELAENRKAFGQARVDAIKLSKIAEAGTEYHEAFHHVSLFLLDDSQREKVYNKARAEYNMPEATNVEIEEELAERFRKYVTDIQDNKRQENKGLASSIANFFKRIWDYVYNVFVGPTRLDNLSIESLFRQIEKGRFRYKKVSDSRIAELRDTYANFEVKGTELNYVKSEEEFREINQNLFFLLAQESGLVNFKDGKFGIALSNMDDLKNIKFGPLYNAVTKQRDRYLSVAANSEAKLVEYTDNPSNALAQEIKDKYLRNPEAPTVEVEGLLRAQVEKALHFGNLFGEIAEKFDTYQESLEDFMLGLNIMKSHEHSDIDDVSDTPTDEDTSEDPASKIYDKASFETSAKHNTAANIKLLLSILPESNTPSELTGLYKFAEFSPLWSQLLRENLGTVSVEDMMEKLRNKASNNFTHAQLVRHIENDENLKTQLFRTIKKTRLDFVNALINKDDNFLQIGFGDTQVQTVASNYVKNWNSLFTRSRGLFTNTKDKGLVPNLSEFTKLAATYNELYREAKREFDIKGDIENILTTKNRLKTLLDKVGIPLKDQELEYILSENGPTEAEGLLGFMQRHVRFIFDEGGTLYQLFQGKKVKLSKGGYATFDNAFSNEKGIRYIASLASESDPANIGDSALGAKGNRYYTITQHTYLTNEIDRIKKDPTTIQDKLKAAYNQNSLWLAFLKDPKNASKLELKTLAAIIRENTGDLGREYQEITDPEEYLIRIIATNEGYATPPTPADRKFYQYFKGLPRVDFNYDLNRNINQEVIDLFKGYVMDEYNRIQLTKAQVDQVIGGTLSHTELVENLHYRYVGRDYDPRENEVVVEGKLLKKGSEYVGGGTQFSHFVEFNKGFDPNALDESISRVLKARLSEEIELATKYGLITMTETNGVNRVATNQLIPDNLLDRHRRRIGDAPMDLLTENIIADNMVNNMMANIEMGKLFTGDPAAFKSAEDYVKRLTGYTSTGDNLRVDFAEGIFNEDELVRAKSYNITTFSSHVVKSQFYDELVDLHTQWNMEAGIAKSKAQAEKIAKDKLASLLKVDQTDAQTFISNEMFRSLAIKLGEWNEAKEAAYQALKNPEGLSREDMLKAYDMVSYPLKMTYMKTNYINGQAYSTFDKMSMATLFRPMVAGTQIEELLDRMELKGKYANQGLKPIHQVKFHTAFKVGIQDRREFFKDESENELTDLTQLTTYEQDFDYLRLQLVTEPHGSGKIGLGSQMKKMGIGDVMMSEDYSDYGNPDVKIKGKDVVNEVHTMLGELSNRGVTDFKNKLFFDDDLHITDKGAFVERLRDEARRAGMSDQVIDALKLEDATGDFYVDFDALPGDRRWIQSRLVSLIKKATVDLDLPGNAFIQMTNIGLRKIDKSDDLRFFTEDGLIEAKVSVSLFADVIPGYKYKTHKERVKFLRDNPDLTAMGYRVPTQGQNSTYMIKIVDFLPENVGDIVVLPAEGTAIGGFDFDIDKMYVVRHNYTKQGTRIKYLNDSNSSAEQRAEVYARDLLRDDINNIRREYIAISQDVAKSMVDQRYIDEQDIDDVVRDLKKSYRDEMNREIDDLIRDWMSKNISMFEGTDYEKQNTTAAVQNRLLDMYFSVWLDRKHAARRTQPLGYGAGLLQDLSLKVRKREGQKDAEKISLKTVSPAYQLDVKSRFKFGKKGLGPYALANVHQILGQAIDFGLFEYLGVGNKTSEDKTTFSELFGKDNEYILEWFSALVDAHVDIAADPYIYYLNVNEFTGDVVTLLLRSGVGGINTMEFVSQPILKEIAGLSESKGNKLDLGEADPLETVRLKYISLAQNAAQEIRIGLDAVDKVFNSEFNLLEAISGVGTPSKRTPQWYADQVTVLNAFEYFKQPATMLKEAILSSRVDTKKFGNNMAQIATYENKVKKALEDEADGVGIRGYSRLYTDTYLGSLTDNSLGLSKGVIGELFMEGKPAFRALVSSLQDAIGRRYSADEYTANLLTDEVYTTVVSDFFVNNMKLNESKIKSMIRGNNSIPNIIYDIQAGDRFPHLKDNPFIKMFTPELQQDAPAFLRFTRPDDKWRKDSITRAWRDILTDPSEEVRDFGVDLFNYSYLTSGLKSTLYSFHDLAPRQLMKDIGFDNYIRIQKSFMQDPSYLAAMMDEVFLNTWYRDDLVPTVRDKKITARGYNSAIIELGKDKNGQLPVKRIGENSDREPIYTPYVKTGKGQDAKLYRYGGYNAETNAPFYYQVEKKSYYNKGFLIKENSLPQTVVGSNRLDINENVKKLLTDEGIGTMINLTDANGKYFFPEFAENVVVTDRQLNNYGEDLEGLTSEGIAKKTQGQVPSITETEQRKKEC